ncbi:nucleoporin NDC1-like isoform X2 [Corticium candelabrum]|uniref:nucleoporin NDC1-like isoform X2 n=1 Tax=Corticium candelabrum TaxID=121492 RepID=UPI002E267039|nr:nucleoporin NDC1-like isoform X2 [Corticium candelabrum]
MAANELFRWRVGASCFWHCLIGPLLSLLFTAMCCLRPSTALTSVSDWWSNVVSLRFWFFCAASSLLSSLCTAWFAFATTVELEVSKTRAKLYFKPFATRFWVLIGIHCLTGTVTGLLSESLHNNLSYAVFMSIKSHDSLEDAHNIGVIWNQRISGALGCWLGLYAATKSIWEGKHCIRFPLLQQHRLYRAKNNLRHVFSSSSKTAFQAIGWFYAVNIIGNLMFLDVFFGWKELMNVSVLCHGIVLSLFLGLYWNIGKLLFMVFLTQPVVFPVAEDCSQHCLTEALKAADSPIHLAYLDLVSVANSYSRRQTVFSVSQPGGQPKVWQSVSKECTKLLNDLTVQLGVKLPEEPSLSQPQTQSLLVGRCQRDWNDMPLPSVPGLLMYRRNLGHHDTELWSASTVSHGLSGMGRQQASHQLTNISNRASQRHVYVNKLLAFKNVARSVVERLMKNAAISYLFTELPNVEPNTHLANCQCQLWAVEALCGLVIASCKEDKYGVVQMELSNIITCLLSLLKAVDLYTKQPIPAIQEELSLKFELKSALQQGLSGIGLTFKHHLKDLNLPPDQLEHLSQFVKY